MKGSLLARSASLAGARAAAIGTAIHLSDWLQVLLRTVRLLLAFVHGLCLADGNSSNTEHIDVPDVWGMSA
jgi:hypothetical protein